MDAFATLAGRVTAELEERGSRFLAIAEPVLERAGAEAFIAREGRAQRNPTHVVPAFRLRDGTVSHFVVRRNVRRTDFRESSLRERKYRQKPGQYTQSVVDSQASSFLLPGGSVLRSARSLGTASALTAAALIAATGAVTSATAASPRANLAGSQPSWANSKALRSAAPAGDYVNIRVYLKKWRDQAAAEKTALAVSTPGSSSYRQFSTPGTVPRAVRAVRSEEIALVQQFLRSSGFSVVNTPSNNHFVAAEGTVAQAESAFATKLGEYAVQGETLRAPESAVSVHVLAVRRGAGRRRPRPERRADVADQQRRATTRSRTTAPPVSGSAPAAPAPSGTARRR